MISWLTNAFPCCKTREKIEMLDQATILTVRNLSMGEDKCTMFPSVNNYECEVETKVVDSTSFRSTNSSRSRKNSKELENNLKAIHKNLCDVCEENSQGFCIGCKDKRYCKKCFDKNHRDLPIFHVFFPYKNREEAPVIVKKQSDLSKLIRRYSQKPTF